MATYSRVKTWSSNETLTSADLNAEFNNIITNTNSGSLNSDNVSTSATWTWTGTHTMSTSSKLAFIDNIYLTMGSATDGDYLLRYSASNTALELSTANSDGSGTDAVVIDIQDGTDDVRVRGGFSTNNATAPTTGIKTGGNIVSDTDSTDDLGTTSVRWANVYTDAVGDSGQTLGVKATTLSFDAASTIDTSGNNNLTLSTGTANVVVNAGVLDVSGDADIDGTLEADAITLNGTALGSLYSPIAGSSSIVTVGTIGTGTWQGTPVASAYLDADTAHLSTTQTFTGDKTFTGTLTVGVNDTGKDVKFFGATSGKYLEWDESADLLNVVGTAAIKGSNGNAAYTQLKLINNDSTSSGETNQTADLVFQFTDDSGSSYDAAKVGAIKELDWVGNADYDGALGFYTVARAADFSGSLAERWRITSTGQLTPSFGSLGDISYLNINTSTNAYDQPKVTFASNTASSHAIDGEIRVHQEATPHANYRVFVYTQSSSNTHKFEIEGDGDVKNANGTYGTISDLKLKQDITDARSYWDDFKALRFKKYRLKKDVAEDENADYRFGLVAQDVELIFPNLVKDSTDFNLDGTPTDTVTKSIKSSILSQIGLRVVQELQTRLEAAEAKIAALESA